DGLLDVYFAQGAPLTGDKRNATAVNRLFRQTPDGTFVDVTARAGVGDPGYGMGASFGDYDRDGDLDIYVTNFGANVLLRNRGDGTFEDVTATAGVDCPLWSVSSGFFDPDGDGDLDLYVANYLDFAFDNHKWCGISQTGVRAYCHPDVYNAVPDCFYRNEGDGRFSEVSREVGILPTADGVGLGVAFADLDGDGHQDIYVANDAQMNYLYLGDGEGRFTESALLAGVGFNDTGAAESSMGVEIGDLDGDGLPDIFLTHLDQQTNTFYRNLGGGLFTDSTQDAGLASSSLAWVGFGTVFFDYDNDGDLDIVVANGHIIDNIELFDAARSHRQPGQLFENLGGARFADISGALGLTDKLVGRGAAAADLDRDGDPDLVIAQNDGPTLVLLNQLQSEARSVAFRLRGTQSNPQGFGARLELRAGAHAQVRVARSSSGYLSQGPPEIHFGLGAAQQVDELRVDWPAGRSHRYLSLRSGFVYTFYEKRAAPTDRSTPPS
ncbi:MAG: CRTAC1 family protein, partial [Thermoanaerobaculia bacterium]